MSTYNISLPPWLLSVFWMSVRPPIAEEHFPPIPVITGIPEVIPMESLARSYCIPVESLAFQKLFQWNHWHPRSYSSGITGIPEVFPVESLAFQKLFQWNHWHPRSYSSGITCIPEVIPVESLASQKLFQWNLALLKLFQWNHWHPRSY